jgi:hypothetical protein
VHFKSVVIGDAPMGFEEDPWEHAGEWLGELCSHPEWLDSPQVVQGLALALTSRFGSLPWMAPSLFAPLADRVERWLEQVQAEGDGALRWEDGDNAILLRTGLALVVGMERGARQRSRELAERLLMLDDQDSLGLCELVLDQLLREGRDRDALELSERESPEEESSRPLGLLMGRVLALYRLERCEEAAEAIAAARRQNPHALPMLCADNPKPARTGRDGFSESGSRAEAWQYRTLMRDQWRTTPGALDWLRNHFPG